MGIGRKHTFKLAHWHKIAAFLMIYDVVAVVAAYFFALWFRFDCQYSSIPPMYLGAYIRFVPIYAVVCVAVFLWLRLYNSIWRFAGFHELLRVIAATVVTAAIHAVGVSLAVWLQGGEYWRMPISYYIFGVVFQFALVLGVRFSYRIVLMERRKSQGPNTDCANVMLVGAGSAGQMLLHDILQHSGGKMRVCCIIDDNRNKWGRYVEGVPVVGGREDILFNVRKYKIRKIFVAIPSASDHDKRTILNICKESGCELKNLPSMYQLADGDVTVGQMREVAVEDLLGRDTIQVNMDEIYDHISGKTILVTGGGGSIGSELCRQVAGHDPKQLIIFDIYENSVYDIEQELKSKYPELNLKACIGSVRDSRCLDVLFATYKPDLVYHAAAHKHVPLMEASPCEAIKNNVVGTYKTAYAAMMHGCSRFVLISTDKAVNPTNIMGASKRLCEMVIQSFDRAVKDGTARDLPKLFTHQELSIEMDTSTCDKFCTEFVAVRFGNVLGSNGSVIPLFKKQIEKGGPVTVTHPDIIRYFMTIPEAVSLVMQAGTYASGGEIFVLDMGAPVRIDDLARNLIKLSGHKPDLDIQVVYTGLRPGEKLYEEKLMAEEGMQKTPNELIHIGNPIPFDTEIFLTQLRRLMDAAYENDQAIRDSVAAMVPTYHPAIFGADKKDATFAALSKEAAEAK